MDLDKTKVDLNWGDEGVLPPDIFPDPDVIFRRMAEVILEVAGPM